MPRLLIEETILQAQAKRPQFPTLCVLATSTAINDGLITLNFYRLTVAAVRLNVRCSMTQSEHSN